MKYGDNFSAEKPVVNMLSKMVVFHAMKGSQANAATYMKIKLLISVDKSGHEYYFWGLSNIYTGHRWFTQISKKAYDHLSNRLAKNYRFSFLPMYKANAHANTVFENQYYV